MILIIRRYRYQILEACILNGAVVFTSIHFREIATILGNKLCIVTRHIKTSESNGKIEIKYNLLKEKVETGSYGIRLAEYSRLSPSWLIDNAKDIATQLK